MSLIWYCQPLKDIIFKAFRYSLYKIIDNFMSKLRILINSQVDKPIKRRFRYLTEATERSPPRPSPQVDVKKMSGINSLSTPKQNSAYHTTQQIKDKLYHKNFSQFKQVFEAESNVETLPFIVSLRQSKQYKYDASLVQPTACEPFEVASKPTLNQKIKKDTSDIDANRARAYQASYRWKKRSGANVRASCEFQTGLRESNQKMGLQELNFQNVIKPIRYKNIESKRYNLKELICEHQKKLFQLKNDKQ